jgi:hypothetical protein
LRARGGGGECREAAQLRHKIVPGEGRQCRAQSAG